MDQGSDRFVSHSVYDPKDGGEIAYKELYIDEPVIVEEYIENKIPDIE